MEYLFLSVAAICGSGLYAFKMYLAAKPACTREEYEKLREKVNKLSMAGGFK